MLSLNEERLGHLLLSALAKAELISLHLTSSSGPPLARVQFSPSELKIETIKLCWQRPLGPLTSHWCSWHLESCRLASRQVFIASPLARLGENEVFHIVRDCGCQTLGHRNSHSALQCCFSEIPGGWHLKFLTAMDLIVSGSFQNFHFWGMDYTFFMIAFDETDGYSAVSSQRTSVFRVDQSQRRPH